MAQERLAITRFSLETINYEPIKCHFRANRRKLYLQFVGIEAF